MNPGAVLVLIAGALSCYVALACLVIWLALVFPQPVARARARLEAKPAMCVLLGLPLALVWAAGWALALTRGAPPGARLLGWGLVVPLSVCATLGGTGLVRLVADRLEAVSGSVTPFGALLRGVAITELATLFPLVGWLIFGPAIAAASLGAGALACRGWPQPAPAVPAPPPASESSVA